MPPMRARHVLGDGGVPVPQRAANMRSDAAAVVEQLHSTLGDTGVHYRPSQAVGHAVPVSQHLDMVVEPDPTAPPVGILVGLGRQLQQGSALEAVEQGLPAAADVTHGAGVQRLQQLADGGVGLVQAEQPPVAQAGQDPALDDLYPNLDLGLVARLADPGRHHGRAVVRRHLLVGAVDPGLIAAGGGDAGLEVVADQLPRGTAEEAEGVDVTTDPVRQALAPADLSIGQTGRAQHGDKDLCCPDLTGRRIDHRQGLPGEVDEQLVASDMGLAHGQRHPAAPRGVEVAEPAVAITLRLPDPILLPQQQQGHPGTAQFEMDPRPVGLWPHRLRGRERRAEQPGL